MTSFYKRPSNNCGTITGFINRDGAKLLEVDDLGEFHTSCCWGFAPSVGDAVEMFVHEDPKAKSCWVLRKRK